MKQIKWSLLLVLLIPFVFLVLPGCSTLQGQGAALDVVGTTPAPVQTGLKCRLLDGNIEAGVANIQGEGFRCSVYGNDGAAFPGCITWKEDGISFWSDGCFKDNRETRDGIPEPDEPEVPDAPTG